MLDEMPPLADAFWIIAERNMYRYLPPKGLEVHRGRTTLKFQNDKTIIGLYATRRYRWNVIFWVRIVEGGVEIGDETTSKIIPFDGDVNPITYFQEAMNEIRDFNRGE